MAPNSHRAGDAHLLLDLCTTAIALGNTIAVHTLEYLSVAKTPRPGIKDCAVEFLEASRALFPAKVSLERSPAQFSADITHELRDRFTQTKNVFVILEHTINKLLANEKAHGLGKLGRGFRGIFSDSEIIRLKASLAQSRASMQISTLMFPSLPDGKVDAVAGIGYTALAAILHTSDPTHGRAKSASPSQQALENLSPERRTLPPTPAGPTSPSSHYGPPSPAVSNSAMMNGPSMMSVNQQAMMSRPTGLQTIDLPHRQYPTSPTASVTTKRTTPMSPLLMEDHLSIAETDATSINQSVRYSQQEPHAIADVQVPKQATHVKLDPSKAPRRQPRSPRRPSSIAPKALQDVVRAGDHKTIEQLLDSGAQPLPGLLTAAVLGQDVETARLLLLYGASANAADGMGRTPLYAATATTLEAAHLLLKYGADPNISSEPHAETPLAHSLSTSKWPFAQLYLQHRADPNTRMRNQETPFMQSITKGMPSAIVELLLLYDAKPDGKNGKGETPLFKAIHAERLDLVTLLLDSGADPNLPGPKIMLWPAVHQPPILQALLERGADLRRAPGVLELATSINSRKAIDLLLKHDADPNAKKDGLYTPLCSAIRDDHEDLVELLLSKGADPNLTALEFPTYKCVTYHRPHILPRILAAGADPHEPKGIIEHCVVHNEATCMRYLLKNCKVDPNARAPNNNTALTTAIRNNNAEMVDLLLSAGADPAVRGGGSWPIDLAVKHPNLLAKLLPHIEVSRINKGVIEQAVIADQLESIKLLLAKGVGVEDKTAGVFSPLTTSIRENRKEIFRYLIDEAGADPNKPGEHLPIIKAIRRHREDDMSYIEHLIAKGADINLIYRGQNAVLQAVDNGDIKILTLLASRGKPDMTARDENGRTVHEILEERGLVEEEKILMAGGKRTPSPKARGPGGQSSSPRGRAGERPMGSQGIVVRRDSPLMGRDGVGR